MSESKAGAVQLFDESAGAMALAQNDAAAVARATQEIQAALVIAQRFPRDEVKLLKKILTACERMELAAISEYEYTRGGTKITGPTIDLLRAIANRWGNIRHGWTEVDRSSGMSSIRAFAWDMQTNTQAERTFKVKHWRDTREGGYVLQDERDIYELCANSASRRVRACLEEVIDSDVVVAAVDQCRLTMKKGAGKVPLKQRAVDMLNAFGQFSVTQEMIEARLGNKLDAVSENQLASLRRVFKSLQDGVGVREDYFKSALVAPEFEPKSAGTAADAKDKLAAAATTPAAVVPPAPEEPEKPLPLKQLRHALKAFGIKEAELMAHWASTGATDGSQSSLEEIFIAAPAVVTSTLERVGDVVAVIKAGRESTRGAK